ncbi:SH3 domain-containing protein [Olleya sp. AS48]|uniref:SH3 domain-containing protein n=1 Tax=Olleya sp. AS48 TaxID=3135774 RepID=UPI00317B7093|tara:strand:- start:994 stop:2118 length:1125 start_codon:yes stop_codon:yes gene_type:complete
MKRQQLIIALITSIFFACNSQTNDNKNMKNTNQPPYNKFSEGEVNIDFDTTIESKRKDIKIAIDSFAYKYPSTKLFDQKISEYYNFNMSNYDNNVLVLQPSLMPEIAIKPLNIIYIESDGMLPISGELLYNYNQYVFYNSEKSFVWLKDNNSFLLKELVTTYGNTHDKDLLQFVFHKVDFNSKIEIQELIFQYKDSKYFLRTEMINKIRAIAYNGKEASSFSDVINEDFYYTLPKIIDKISINQALYNTPEKSIAFLLNELAKSGITGSIDSYLNNNSNFLKILVDQNYFDNAKLKEYVTVIYTLEKKTVLVQVIDKDGYTNLRKSPNSKSEIIQQIKTGDNLEVITTDGDWILVKTNENQKGYVHKTKVADLK